MSYFGNQEKDYIAELVVEYIKEHDNVSTAIEEVMEVFGYAIRKVLNEKEIT